MTKSNEKIRHQSGVWKYRKKSPTQRLRQWWQCRNIGNTGQGLYVEPNVKFLRHPEHIFLGNNVIVKEGVRICPARPESTIKVGEWTTIGYHTFIFSSAEISIGENCLIAPFCYLVDTNHGLKRGELIREQPMSAAPIVVQDDVWLGTRVIVLKGVTIGRGAVVSAGSVVSSDVPENAIVAGNPAVVIDERR